VNDLTGEFGKLFRDMNHLIHIYAYVFITGRRQSELDAAVKQIGKNNVSGIQGDVSNLADLDRLYAAAKKQKGHIDILFAIAGVGELEAEVTVYNSCRHVQYRSAPQ
jgi:NAD(P)-dependent dehydrogenase (short-subunit alcohol dehydrogenase family)